MAPKEKKPICFVVSPIGEDGSAERIHADWLLEGIIDPVFKAHFPQFDIVRADRMHAPGQIDAQIIRHLLEAELVIADITLLNPNVFYEIGIRHASNAAVIHMVRAGDYIPFDLKLFRHVPFSVATPQKLETAKADLKAAVAAVLEEDFKVENPVTVTRGVMRFAEQATSSEKILLNQIAEISSRLSALEAPKRGYSNPPPTPLSRVIRASDIAHFSGSLSKITITVKHPIGMTDQYSELVEGTIAHHFNFYEVAHSAEETVYSVEGTTANFVAAEAAASDLAQQSISAEIQFPQLLKKKPL
jgi:hypothetical protein